MTHTASGSESQCGPVNCLLDMDPRNLGPNPSSVLDCLGGLGQIALKISSPSVKLNPKDCISRLQKYLVY